MYNYKICIGERSFAPITSDLLDFHPNKTEQYLQMNVFGALMKHHVLLAIQAKPQTRKLLQLFGRDRLSGKIHKCGKSRETLKFLNAAISKYIQLNFSYVM